MKIIGIRCHTGIQLGTEVVTSSDVKRHDGVTFESVSDPQGVLVGFKGKYTVVPLANISSISVEPQAVPHWNTAPARKL